MSNGRARSEADKLSDDSLERIKNAYSTAVRTDAMSTETLSELQAQGEKLKNVQGVADDILYQQELAKRHERSIRSFFWSIYNMFIPEPKRVDHNIQFEDNVSDAQIEKPVSVTQSGVNTLFVNADNSTKTNRQKRAETDAYLAQMSDVMTGLHQKAVLTGEELDRQNERLKVLDPTLDNANTNFDNLNRNIKSML